MKLAGLRMVFLHRANNMPPWRVRRTPNTASGIAAYYSATAQYVSWVHQLLNPAIWAGGQDLTQHDLWTASNLVDLRDTHARLIQDYHCFEGSPDVMRIRVGRVNFHRLPSATRRACENFKCTMVRLARPFRPVLASCT